MIYLDTYESEYDKRTEEYKKLDNRRKTMARKLIYYAAKEGFTVHDFKVICSYAKAMVKFQTLNEQKWND